MASDKTKVIGWLYLIGGLIALWAAWSSNYVVGIAILGLIFVASGYDHLSGHK